MFARKYKAMSAAPPSVSGSDVGKISAAQAHFLCGLALHPAPEYAQRR